jgi:ubiquinone/menaquinone biosynthesis C-methylase UbiE
MNAHGSRATGINADEIRYWNSPATAAWVTLQERLDALLAPVTEVALEHAAPQAGEHVLDIGCGCGATMIEIAKRVGPEGRVLGVDVSEPMTARARARLEAEVRRNIAVALGDASVHPFNPGAFDLAFSRFGVMFFANPVEAFANIRRALKPGGRLVFTCFRAREENPWVTRPFAAARDLLPPIKQPGPEDPGQFSFADPERVRRILEGAGFRDLRFIAHDTLMRLGRTAREAADFSIQIGPTTRALTEAPEEARRTLRGAVRQAVEREFAHCDGAEGVALQGAIWIVLARA